MVRALGYFWGYLHGPGLAAAGLTIREDRAIESSDNRADDRHSNILINVDLISVRSKYAIKGKAILVFIDLTIR